MGNDVYNEGKAPFKRKITSSILQKKKRGTYRPTMGREFIVMGFVMMIAALLGAMFGELFIAGYRNNGVILLFVGCFVAGMVSMLWGTIRLIRR